MQDRQEECAGLAAARARLDHQIASGKKVGDGPGLNGHQPCPASAGGGVLRQLGQFRKTDGWQGVLRLDQICRIDVLIECACFCFGTRYRRVRSLTFSCIFWHGILT